MSARQTRLDALELAVVDDEGELFSVLTPAQVRRVLLAQGWVRVNGRWRPPMGG